MRKIIIVIFVFCLFKNVESQNIKLSGIIKNDDKEVLPGCLIRVVETNIATTSDPNGYYELKLFANSSYNVIFSFMNSKNDTVSIITSTTSIRFDYIIKTSDFQLSPIYTYAFNVSDAGIERINSKSLSALPNLTGNAVETLLKTTMGVASSNELSSQYNVRGGNFDENLVYINDIEVFRPFLIRSGQQEGMSIINSDLVENIKFSAGGFEAQYADKMSSVLDITYKKPQRFNLIGNLGLINQRLYVENLSKNQKFGTLLGLRYKRSDYLLKTLEVAGAYKPIFADIQLYNTFDLSSKFNIGLLFISSSNVYNFFPENSESEMGTFTNPIKITVNYLGSEKDSYTQYFGALSFNYRPNNNFTIISNFANYISYEEEKFDILAYYSLADILRQSDTTSKDSLQNWGYGQYLTHARNKLFVNTKTANLKLMYTKGKHTFISGFTFSKELFEDNLKEWKYVDSAGYSITPNHIRDSSKILLYYTKNASNLISINRYSGYLQDKFEINTFTFKLNYNLGVRFSYNSYNKEILISPRITAVLFPKNFDNWYFRFSSGLYYQPPLYREMRDFEGKLVYNLKSQRSIHLIFGAYNSFKMWNRPFKFSTELYYKKLDNLIPYEIDNLRVQYYTNQRSKGFATGIDMKMYGEFIPGTDSWLSVSFLKTMEDIIGDSYMVTVDSLGKQTDISYEIVDTLTIYPGYIPRPADQLLNFGLFFQDYIPGNENIRVSLALYFGTPAPFGPPQTQRYMATIRSARPYFRSDISFVFVLKNPNKKYNNFFDKFSTISLNVDVYNFMGVRNRSGYTWLDIVPLTTYLNENAQFDKIATPQSLTGRLLNFNLKFEF